MVDAGVSVPPGPLTEVCASYKGKILLKVMVETKDSVVALATAKSLGYGPFLDYAVVIQPADIPRPVLTIP